MVHAWGGSPNVDIISGISTISVQNLIAIAHAHTQWGVGRDCLLVHVQYS